MKSLCVFEIQELADRVYRAVSIIPGGNYEDRTFLDKTEALKFIQRQVSMEIIKNESDSSYSPPR
jgi:hypothetical protein